jgi:hypothetical protein
MHNGDRFYYIFTAHALSSLVQNSRYGATGWNPNLPLTLHNNPYLAQPHGCAVKSNMKQSFIKPPKYKKDVYQQTGPNANLSINAFVYRLMNSIIEDYCQGPYGPWI